MTQKTVVIELGDARGRELQRALEQGPFDFRPAPHARFSAKGEGVVATLYQSGKLVVQGDEPETFLAHYLGVQASAGAPSFGAETTVGSDESGKGDYFGPLVVAAARVEPALAQKLAAGPVRDSKVLSDETCLRLGAALRAQVPNAVHALLPREYNAEYARWKNLNPLLAALHGRAIRELAAPGMLVVVDQFGGAHLMRDALAGADVRLVQRPRGEEILAVAVASVLARERFLVELRALSDEFAIDLCKGAGDPTERAARRFLALHGDGRLGEVAKLHFKTTRKLGALP